MIKINGRWRHTKETKEKMGAASKGHPNYNKGGWKHTKEAKEKMSKARMLNNWQRGRPSWNKGLTAKTDERVKMGMERTVAAHFAKKANGTFKYWKLSEETKGKMRESRLKRIREGQITYDYMKGDKNPTWNGGSSSYWQNNLSEFKKLRKAIIKRDFSKCQLCGENISGSDINIHHIDYNKLNNVLENLICLGRSCHSKTNSNRSFWMHFFQEILKKRETCLIPA